MMTIIGSVNGPRGMRHVRKFQVLAATRLAAVPLIRIDERTKSASHGASRCPGLGFGNASATRTSFVSGSARFADTASEGRR